MKTYTRDEKIKYYEDLHERALVKYLSAKHQMERYSKKLEHIKSDEYQDWNSELQKQLDNKKGESA